MNKTLVDFETVILLQQSESNFSERINLFLSQSAVGDNIPLVTQSSSPSNISLGHEFSSQSDVTAASAAAAVICGLTTVDMRAT